jgi:hypothetical protein
MRDVCEQHLTTLLQKLRDGTLTNEETIRIHAILAGNVCSHDQSLLSYLFTGWYLQNNFI